jgi:hypothetical protein
MRNAKLRKTVTIPELTQANIDSAENISGLVNPSKVSFGGGGDEVLKDWTRTTALKTNLLDGLLLNGNYKGVVVEFDNVQGDAGGGGDINAYTHLVFKMSGNVDIALANRSSENISQRAADGNGQGYSDDRFTIFTGIQSFKNGFGTARLMVNSAKNSAGYIFEGASVLDWNNGLKNNFLKFIASFWGGGVIPQELWLNGVSDPDVPFSADYRIIRVGSSLPN